MRKILYISSMIVLILCLCSCSKAVKDVTNNTIVSVTETTETTTISNTKLTTEQATTTIITQQNITTTKIQTTTTATTKKVTTTQKPTTKESTTSTQRESTTGRFCNSGGSEHVLGDYGHDWYSSPEKADKAAREYIKNIPTIKEDETKGSYHYQVISCFCDEYPFDVWFVENK